jgi:hypothetical protein
MFGLCQDAFTREMLRRGYGLVALPDASIRPLQVLGRDGSSLSPYGEAARIFLPGLEPVPEAKPEIHVAPIDVRETSFLDRRLGINVVSKWLGGDKAGVTGRLNRSARFRLKLSDIIKYAVDLDLLDKFLANAKLHDQMPTIEDLLNRDKLYIVNAVLTSPAMMLESEGNDLVDADFDIPDVGYGASGGAKVKVESKQKRQVEFKSDIPVVFAFQAVQIFYEDGRYVALHPNRSDLVVRGDDDEIREPRETGWLSDANGWRFAQFTPSK